jgi:hypothetical protein
MQPQPLSPHAKRLVSQLEAATHVTHPAGPTYHMTSLGGGFYFAYEQLRNVAEYREHHLLLRGAIERYLRRYVNFARPKPSSTDLANELIQSGYVPNDSVPVTTLDAIDRELELYSQVFQGLKSHHVADSEASRWLEQTASVEIENLLAPDPRGAVFMRFAYEHYFYTIDRAATIPEGITDHDYRVSLFCAVHRAIFKSDLATTRFYCVSISLPDIANQPPQHVTELNRLIDNLYADPITNRLTRLINRYGAPIRIMRELVMESSVTPEMFASKSETISRVKDICTSEYARTKKSLGSRIAKSIFFIFLTKTLVGISIEVPWDLFTVGSIDWEPLLINIAFPIIYMLGISSRISMPSRQNTDLVASYVERILYEPTPFTYKPKRRVTGALSTVFSFVYAVGFVGSFIFLIWLLNRLGFNIVQGLIFFLFFSAVSFLGFRIRQQAHELAMLDESENLLQTFLDFLSSPFVRVGHWLSDKYAKANIVTMILDLAIEMPIKTTLRMLRQWARFMRDKQEEI